MIEEEQKTKLISEEQPDAGMDAAEMNFNDGADGDGLDLKPSSSRVKKVLIWSEKHQEFEMKPEDKEELQKAYFTNNQDWAAFERQYKSLNP